MYVLRTDDVSINKMDFFASELAKNVVKNVLKELNIDDPIFLAIFLGLTELAPKEILDQVVGCNLDTRELLWIDKTLQIIQGELVTDIVKLTEAEVRLTREKGELNEIGNVDRDRITKKDRRLEI